MRVGWSASMRCGWGTSRSRGCSPRRPSWQFAYEVVSRYDGDVEELTSAESTATEAVVSLAGEMAEHLLDPEDVSRYIDEFEVAMRAVPKGVTKKRSHPMETERVLPALRNRRAILPMVRAYLDLKRSATRWTSATRWRWRRGSHGRSRASG